MKTNTSGPELAPGRYEILVYVPEQYGTTSHARYWISHAGGLTTRQVDQSINHGRWVSLGTYRFRGSQQDYLSRADVTFESSLSRRIVFDAAKWGAPYLATLPRAWRESHRL